MAEAQLRARDEEERTVAAHFAKTILEPQDKMLDPSSPHHQSPPGEEALFNIRGASPSQSSMLSLLPHSPPIIEDDCTQHLATLNNYPTVTSMKAQMWQNPSISWGFKTLYC